MIIFLSKLSKRQIFSIIIFIFAFIVSIYYGLGLTYSLGLSFFFAVVLYILTSQGFQEWYAKYEGKRKLQHEIDAAERKRLQQIQNEAIARKRGEIRAEEEASGINRQQDNIDAIKQNIFGFGYETRPKRKKRR